MLIELLSVLIGFLTTFLIIPPFIKYFKKVGISDTDEHKKNKPLISTSIGIPIMIGFVSGILTYSLINTLNKTNLSYNLEIFGIVLSVVFITFSGFLDDLNTKQVKKDGVMTKEGLKQWQKPLLTLPAAIPLIILRSDIVNFNLPIFGEIYLGLLYPIILVPFILVIFSNMINFFGGFNGSEIGIGIIHLVPLLIISVIFNNQLVTLISLIAIVSLLAGFLFNFNPAKILGGDSLPYFIGSVLASIIILLGVKFAIIITLPFIIEFLLKFRRKLKVTDLGVLQQDGTLKSRYRRIYSIKQLIIKKGRFTETQVVLLLYLFHLFFAITNIFMLLL